MAAVAVVPWNNFSNFSRAFDPAFFYSALGGPLTRSSGPFAMTSAILVLAVIALIRARRTGLTRSVAALAGVVAAVGGFAVTENAARGIVVPLRGATASLWIEWQIPLFLLLFAFWLAAAWLLRIAMGRRPMVELRLRSSRDFHRVDENNRAAAAACNARRSGIAANGC
jgi:hypothetical protein